MFTWNNPPNQIDISQLPDFVSYLVYQREKGESGTEHYQGYIELTSRQRFTTLQRKLGWVGVHWEAARGTPTQCRNYCMKEESRIADPVEYGIVSKVTQGTILEISNFLNCRTKD